MRAKNNVSKGEKPMTKTGFIRSMPPDVAPSEVIAKAKELGLELTKKLVWTTQSEMRGESRAAGKKTAKTARKAKPQQGKKTGFASAAAEAALADSTAPVVAESSTKKAGSRGSARRSTSIPAGFVIPGALAEQKMRALIVELGTARADLVFRTVKSELAALVGSA